MALMGGYCFGCQCQKSQVHVFARTISWAPPGSLLPSRMNVSLPSSDPYRDAGWHRKALWNVDQPARLVVLENSGVLLFGAHWNVAVMSRCNEVLRTGTVHCNRNDLPYCLLQIKTDNPALPKSYNNRWILAVGLLDQNYAKEFDPTKKFRFYCGDRPNVEPDANWLDVEPVEWNSDESEINVGIGILSLAPCECQPAEAELISVIPQQALVRDPGIDAEMLRK
jgi:hypothetical protein